LVTSAIAAPPLKVSASGWKKIVSLQKIQGQLQDAGALETIAHYLALLEEEPGSKTRASRTPGTPGSA